MKTSMKTEKANTQVVHTQMVNTRMAKKALFGRGTGRRLTAAMLALGMVVSLGFGITPASAYVVEDGDAPAETVPVVFTAPVVEGSSDSEGLVGAAAARADGEKTLEDMLLYAIQDEYAAQAEFIAIMEAYGTQRPFSNILRAEQTHIDLLLPLFETYGVTVPVNDAASRTEVPASLAEAYDIGVVAEEVNIAMYVSFLEQQLPDDARLAFERLMNASVSHLNAFENAAEGTGNGYGRTGDTGNRGFAGRSTQSGGSVAANGTEESGSRFGSRGGSASAGYRGGR